MRTLIVSPRQFWPLDTGGKLRDYHLAAQLAQSAQVTYLCFTDTDEPCPATLAAPFEEIIAIRRGPAYGLKTLVKGLVGSEPATVLNYTTPGMTTALQNLLARKDFDTIQVETVCLAAYMPALRTARSHPGIVTDWHNIESELMDRHAEHTASAPRRLYAQMTAAKLRTAEARQIELSDAVLVPSTRERAKLIQDGAQCPIYVVENGVEAGKFNTTVKRPDASALLFVGSMDYHANIDAVLDFATSTWPLIHNAHPDLTFKIVGRNPGPAVSALASIPGIVVTGSVPDVLPYYAEALASVVPLRVGGGTRLKILEAMAARVPVISTTLGAEGLEGIDGTHLIIADTPAAISAAVTQVLTQKDLAERLSGNAQQLITQMYDWSVVGRELAEIHSRLQVSKCAA